VLSVAVAVAAVDAVDVGAVDVGAVDVDAVDVGPWWGCLSGRSFLDGRRKRIRSQQQRSSNEKEIRTAAEKEAGLFGTCPEQRVISEYNSTSQEQGWSDGLTVGLAVADHFINTRFDHVDAVNDIVCRQTPVELPQAELEALASELRERGEHHLFTTNSEGVSKIYTLSATYGLKDEYREFWLSQPVLQARGQEETCQRS
jgi:hypothetical protein